MKNIMFTTYFSKLEEFLDLPDYNAILEILLITKIQDKLNRVKKAKKIMISLSSEVEKDCVEQFVNNYHHTKHLKTGIINLPLSTKTINWNALTHQEKKNFLMEKWKLLFNNLSEDYFVVDKSEVIDILEKMKTQEWKVEPLFKKQLSYNNEKYVLTLNISPLCTQVLLIRTLDGKKYVLKNYQTRQIMFDTDFKDFILINDTLILKNKNIFLPSEQFNLKEIIKDS
jgi:hypothetical protein